MGMDQRWAWAFDKAIESLAVHPAIWPIILELTQGRPQLSGPGERVGVAIYDDVHTQGNAGRFGRNADGGTRANWHSTAEGGSGNQRREGGGYDMAELEVLADGTLYCTNFVVFPYLVRGSQRLRWPSCLLGWLTQRHGRTMCTRVMGACSSFQARIVALSIAHARCSTGPVTQRRHRQGR